MKKILLGILALSLVSGVALADGGKKKTKKKAKTECTKNCPPSKDCKKTTANCPPRPGCICH